MLVDVLLATYNGSKYLEDQLDSIFSQTYQNFRILISDDGSSDSTMVILKAYEKRFGERLIVIPNLTAGGGLVRNFENLMRTSLEDNLSKWAFFCDQDDVWFPEKIERMLKEMIRIENLSGENTPCLVHSDLVVVDENLKIIFPSFSKCQLMDPSNCSPVSLLSVNQVTGCATMVNRSLLKMALPLPGAIIMHDWWCGLISSSGHRYFIKAPLILYRQHNSNQVGVKGRDLKNRLRRFFQDAVGAYKKIKYLGQNTYIQSQALRERLIFHGFSGVYVENYIAWRNKPWWSRMAGCKKYYNGPWFERFIRCFLWFKPPESVVSKRS